MTTPTDKMMDRVRALLAKAESTEFPEEAEALSAKAMELITRHGIDRAVLAASGDTQETVTTMDFTVTSPYHPQKITLLNQIAVALRCVCIKQLDRKQVTVFGFTSDLETLTVLYTSLLLQAENGLRHQPVPWRENARTFRIAWMIGFAVAVSERLKQAEQAAQADVERGGPSVSLVLADRKREVERAFKQANPRTRSETTTYRGSGADYGYEAGEGADIGTARLGGRRALGR